MKIPKISRIIPGRICWERSERHWREEPQKRYFFGREASLNTGASSDLRSATDMAMRVIATYGMDEENLVCLSPEQILNTTLAKEFIERTNRLLKEQMKETENLICSGREKVEALAKKLLEQNHLTQNEIQNIFDET